MLSYPLSTGCQLTEMNGQTEMKARIRQLEDALRQARSSEAEARETLARYRVAADNLTDIVWTLDADLKTTFVTPPLKVTSVMPFKRWSVSIFAIP